MLGGSTAENSSQEYFLCSKAHTGLYYDLKGRGYPPPGSSVLKLTNASHMHFIRSIGDLRQKTKSKKKQFACLTRTHRS